MKENMNQGMGIYVHIPFCVKKCEYCDFLSAPADEKIQERYFHALLNELDCYENGGKKERVSTIFFGGGTPSLWKAEWIKTVIKKIQVVFAVDEDAEISMESNPGTITKEKAEGYKEAGISRISIGVQSTHDRILKELGRIHTYEEFLDSFSIIREAGFRNVNIDLMSGLPHQSFEDYKETLCEILKLEPEHISAYSLIVEEGTPFYERKLSLPDEDTERKMYEITGQMLAEHGYERYEISNYAKPGYECRHNMTYWDEVDYLGIGLGASSYYKGVRFKNEGSLIAYLRLLENKEEEKKEDAKTGTIEGTQEDTKNLLHKLRKEVQVLTEEEKMEEYCFLGLRKMAGISISRFNRQYHHDFGETYGKIVEKYVRMGLLVWKDEDHIALSEHGIDVSNVILADFLL